MQGLPRRYTLRYKQKWARQDAATVRAHGNHMVFARLLIRVHMRPYPMSGPKLVHFGSEFELARFNSIAPVVLYCMSINLHEPDKQPCLSGES